MNDITVKIRRFLFSALLTVTVMACMPVSTTEARTFDCSVVYDEYDQLMLANFLVEPERYVDALANLITRQQHVQYQLGEFKLRRGREESGIAVFVTNQSLHGKMLFVWQDNAWEERTPLVIEEIITFGRIRDGYAPVRQRSVYLLPGSAVDLDSGQAVDPEDETADLIYEFEQGVYSLRRIEPTRVFFPIESLCHQLEAAE